MAQVKEPVKNDLQFETVSVHAGLDRPDNEVKVVPIYASTSFVFNDSAHGAAIFGMNAEAFCYSRIGNPTVDVFEKRMAALEGGAAALATASGESAIFVTITSLAQRGSNVVVVSDISETTNHQFKHRLPPLGIEVRFIEDEDLAKVQLAIDEMTKAVFVETLSTERLVVANLPAIAKVAHENGIPLIVDNTNGAGGYLVRPIKHGADIVVQSAAPWLSISGNNQGGIIIDSGKFPWDKSEVKFPLLFEPSPGFHGLRMWEKFGKLAFISFARIAVLRDIGPCLNPYEASMLLAGLDTLAVRMNRVCRNGLELASWLCKDVNLDKFAYPGLSKAGFAVEYLERNIDASHRTGGLIFFTLKDPASISELCSKFRLVATGSSIGGSRTLIIPSTSTLPKIPKEVDISRKNHPNPQIYISVGLENISDIKADFVRAFSNL